MAEMMDPRATFGEALLEMAEENDKIVALSGDSSSGSGMTGMKEKFPDRHIEMGIMEQGIIGYASGLATTGLIPFVAAIAPFVTARPFEMFRNDLGYMRQNVKVVGRSSGLTYSDLGATHQSLDDIAIIRTIPGVVVITPGDPLEIRRAVRAAVEHVGPVYIKIGSPKMPVLSADKDEFEIGKAIRYFDGDEVTIIGCGTVFSKAYDAAVKLRDEGVSVRLLDMHTIKPIDVDAILDSARKTGKIVTVEEHYLHGGLGGAVAEVLAKHHPTPMKMIGVDDQFASNGPYEELLGLYGLQGDQIAETVKEFLAS